MNTDRQARCESFRRFLGGGSAERPYVALDPSSFAAEYAGKWGGHPTAEDNLAFHEAFPSDAPLTAWLPPEEFFGALAWRRTLLREEPDGPVYEETLEAPGGPYRRVVAHKRGMTEWLLEPAVKGPDDLALVDHYAQCVRTGAADYARAMAEQLPDCAALGYLPAAVVLTAFEAYYLVDYTDAPLLWHDAPERFAATVARVHEANLAVIERLMGRGVELVAMGSAGLELLSPTIFDEAIIPHARETTDLVRSLDGFTSYHICGHSRQLLETGRIDAIRPTWFETISPPPCGNNPSLSESLSQLDEEIISKGNLPLELLRDGTPAEVVRAVEVIRQQTRGRRHIVGQADATILSGTPAENIRAFVEAAESIG